MRITKIEQNYYREDDFYQMSFYYHNGELSSPNTSDLNLKSEENYIDYKRDYEIISSNKTGFDLEVFLMKYISLLSSEATDHYSIFKASYRNKMLFITVVTILLAKTYKSLSLTDYTQELFDLFFSKLPDLEYHPDKKNDLVPQDLIGLLRSEHLSRTHLQMAHEDADYLRRT